jgi:hypothetical protein
MTMYDDNRVVTLLREIDPPLSPPDRLQDVRRRARRGESRRASALAGVMAVVLAAGVIAAVQLPGRGTEVLTVAGAAQTTTDAGSARVTIHLDLVGLQAGLPADVQTELPKSMQMSGAVDFVHRRFVMRGSFSGEPFEQRGIGADRWDRTNDGRWEHSTDSGPGNDFDLIDPSRLLSKLTSGGETLSTSRKGDRTVFRLRVPSKLLFDGDGGDGAIDVRVEADDDGRVRTLSTTVRQPSAGGFAITVTFDDFGIDVDVQPPPADQVTEAGDNGGSSGTSQEFSGTTGSSSSPEDRKKVCEQIKAFKAQQPAPKTEQERAQRAQFDQAIAQACAKS